ncbi:MAG: lysostaphin resistance A-like protein [Gaiellaceae bacterium]
MGWLVLVGAMIAVAYFGRATEGKPDPQVLYRWSTAAGGLVQDGIILAVVLALARGNRALLGLHRPWSIWRALRIVGLTIVGIYAFELLYGAIAHPGNEQGLTPGRWEPSHAVAYVVNGIVICSWIPFVEEVTFRGLGYSLLERFGRWPAILVVGVIFGLAHGLVVSLPVIVVFGCVLAWIRSTTRSVYPGMLAHATFNLIALVAAVTIGTR